MEHEVIEVQFQFQRSVEGNDFQKQKVSRLNLLSISDHFRSSDLFQGETHAEIHVTGMFWIKINMKVSIIFLAVFVF